jgi:hypothetical protein
LQGETRGEADAARGKNEMDGPRRTEGRRKKKEKKNDCGLGLGGGWLGADGVDVAVTEGKKFKADAAVNAPRRWGVYVKWGKYKMK